jgi:WD40 repeat protein
VWGQPDAGQPTQWKQSLARPSRGWDYDGERILGHVDYRICLWDATIGKLLKKHRYHKERIVAVQLSPDGKYFLSSSWMCEGPMQPDLKSRDTRTLLSSLTAGASERSFSGEVAGEFSPDGKRILTFSLRPGEDSRFDAAVWDVASERQLAAAKLGEYSNPDDDTLHFSPDGRRFVRLSSGVAVLYDASDGHEIAKHSERPAFSLHYTSNGALASYDLERFKLTDIESGRVIHSVPHGLKGSHHIGWTHDGSRAAAVRGGHDIKICDFGSGKMTTGARCGPSPVQDAIVSPDNRRLAVEWGGANSIEPGLGLYDMQTGKEIVRIKLPEWGRIIGFAPDSKTFLVGGSEFVIYNSEDGKAVRSLKLLDEVSFSHDWKK